MFSWSVPSRLAAVTYLEDTASVLGIQIYQLKIATQLTWIITERWAVDYTSNSRPNVLNHSRRASSSVFRYREDLGIALESKLSPNKKAL